ncbi:MAG: hypothetical protein GF334_01245 [Candidatus Altiarchaeales archaeon]|nr:hypothetical protein [Candidatus Altiarchaeales archaeon]
MATTADFWREGTNRENVIGGPSRIIVSKRSVTTYPELISDVLNLSTYQPQANWYDLGHSSTPFANTSGFDTTEWESQQAGVIDIQVGNWNRTITVTLMESKNDKVMEVVHEADGQTTNADGDDVKYMWDKSDVTEWRVVAVNLQENDDAGSNIVMDVFPNCKRSGADSETAWDRGNPQVHSLELRPFPDPSAPLDANWYRITQQ